MFDKTDAVNGNVNANQVLFTGTCFTAKTNSQNLFNISLGKYG